MFKANENFEKELIEEGDYLSGLASLLTGAIGVVRAMSPVASGKFRDSIEVEIVDDEVRLGSGDPVAHIVEWGSVNNPPYAPIRRGVRAVGLRLDESPKS
jgi:hypothetical protein